MESNQSMHNPLFYHFGTHTRKGDWGYAITENKLSGTHPSFSLLLLIIYEALFQNLTIVQSMAFLLSLVLLL